MLPRLLAEGRGFDLAFLDGNHRFEGVFLDLVYSGRVLGSCFELGRATSSSARSTSSLTSR